MQMETCRKSIRQTLGAAAVLLICVSVAGDAPPPEPDLRPQKLEAFFESFQCPQPWYVDDYLAAADTYHIDYRLLPVVSVLESTCGVYQRGNNHWGWNSARTGFASVPDGIDFVARQLALHPYQGKPVAQKLHTYNPRPRYVQRALELLDQVDKLL